MFSLPGAVSDVEMQEHYDEFFEVGASRFAKGLFEMGVLPGHNACQYIPPPAHPPAFCSLQVVKVGRVVMCVLYYFTMSTVQY